MSYIVPRQKPTACRNCHFMDRITYDCKLMRTKDYPDFEIQYANCPLIEVPTPHGRLIDVDAPLEKVSEMMQEPDYQHEGENWMVGLIMARDAIDEADTIIEAEGEK